MKALTLRQPSASLVAVGVKKIETRSWSTEYRGRIAIHAGRREPPTLLRALRWTGGFWSMEYGGRDDPTWYLAANAPSKVEVASLPDAERLPLGAVVASATLVDVVPTDDLEGDGFRIGFLTGDCDEHLILAVDSLLDRDLTYDLIDERPVGDFTPGRFAWLLNNVARVEDRCPWCGGPERQQDEIGALCPASKRGTEHCDCSMVQDECCWCGIEWLGDGVIRCPVCSGAGKCAPIPARGRQGLWEWTP